MGDYGLQMAWSIGDLMAGQTATIEYDYIFGTNQPRVVAPLPTLNTLDGDLAPNVYSLASPAATAELVDFEGGILRLTGRLVPQQHRSRQRCCSAFPMARSTPARGTAAFRVSSWGPAPSRSRAAALLPSTHANTYAGGTIIVGSTAAVGDSAALGTGPVTFNGGTLLILLDGLTLPNAATLAGDGTIDTQSFDLVLLGAIGGSGRLEKTGCGRLGTWRIEYLFRRHGPPARHVGDRRPPRLAPEPFDEQWDDAGICV